MLDHKSICGDRARVTRAVAPGRGDNNMLVISRSVLKLRDFKIIVGLADMSCTTASIPLVEGARKRHAASIATSTPKSVSVRQRGDHSNSSLLCRP